MTGSATKTPSPPAPPDDADIADERSSVRPRVEAPGAPASDGVTRRASVDALIRRAKVLLADLPSGDRRSNLLKLAITRRDEVLLDRLLSLESSAISSPPPHGD